LSFGFFRFGLLWTGFRMRLPHDKGSESAARTRARGSERQGCDTYWTHGFLLLVTYFTKTTNEREGLGHLAIGKHSPDHPAENACIGSLVPFTIISACFKNMIV
jgi:hypothetical protein